MSLPKWNEERTAELESLVESGQAVTQSELTSLAERLETTVRSVASKLRKMGYEVEKTEARGKAFSAEQEEVLRTFVTDNSGQYTYAEIAEAFEDGAFSTRQIQGKLLSMELTAHVRPTPKVEAERKFSEAEEGQIVSLVAAGKFLEEIAEALGREINSIRGKALSLLRNKVIEAMPKQRDHAPSQKVDVLDGLDIAAMTVVEIAEATGKTPRGIKTTLTRRGLTAADYDGAAKKAANE
jgi:hypothetical protein